MEILDVGIPELIVIFVIIMLVMGPEDVQKTARTLGRWVRAARSSEIWQGMVQVSRELRWQFTRLSREAGLDESLWNTPQGRRVDIEESIRQRLFATSNNQAQNRPLPTSETAGEGENDKNPAKDLHHEPTITEGKTQRHTPQTQKYEED